MNMSDQVNHPDHYNSGKVECIDGLESALGDEQFKGFLRGNALKYLWRCGYKDKPLQELGKAKWYIDKLEEVYNSES